MCRRQEAHLSSDAKDALRSSAHPMVLPRPEGQAHGAPCSANAVSPFIPIPDRGGGMTGIKGVRDVIRTQHQLVAVQDYRSSFITLINR
jgi:hypothetical protein